MTRRAKALAFAFVAALAALAMAYVYRWEIAWTFLIDQERTAPVYDRTRN